MYLKDDDVVKIVERVTGTAGTKIVSHCVRPFFQQREAGINGDAYSLEIEIDEEEEEEEKAAKFVGSSEQVTAENRSKREIRRSKFKFFVKVRSSSALMRKLSDPRLVQEETEFFRLVIPRLLNKSSLPQQDQLQDSRSWSEEGASSSSSGLEWAPRCYFARDDLLVLEDLRERNYAPSESSIFKEELLLAALATLAKFHASTLAAEARLGQPLSRLFPQLFSEKLYALRHQAKPCSSSSCYSLPTSPLLQPTRLAFSTLALLAKMLGYDRGAALVPSILDYISDVVKPLADGQTMSNCICHGDLWRTNILFSYRDDVDQVAAAAAAAATADAAAGTVIPQCIIVDYQMLRYASPCTDLAMLLCLHASREYRQRSELSLLDRYFNDFQGLLQLQRDPKVTSIPSRDGFIQDYRRCRLFGLACLCLSWPRTVFTTILDDPVAFESWYTRSRIDVYRSCIDKDPEYRKFLDGNLKELFDEAQRVLTTAT